jgi:hypothetical protein
LTDTTDKTTPFMAETRTTQVQQLWWPMAYWPPRRRSTRWRVDSFWIL